MPVKGLRKSCPIMPANSPMAAKPLGFHKFCLCFLEFIGSFLHDFF